MDQNQPVPSVPQQSASQTQQITPSDQPPPKRNRMLSIIALALIGIGVACLAFWYYQSEVKKTTVTATHKSNVVSIPEKLVVGTDPTYPPMEYRENAGLNGYDIDLAKFIGKELGTQIEFRDIVFDDLFTKLDSGEIDMIISTVTVSAERKKKYDFSQPYLQGGQVILTQKTNTTITTTNDLQGKKIAVQKGTTIEAEALKYTTDALVIRYPDFVEATSALIKGEVDAIFADLPGAKGITNENPTLKIASDPFTKEDYAVVFRKGDRLVKEVDEALTSLEAKGILVDIKQKWLD